MSDIWITSDTHYHHKNIVAGTSSWGDSDGGIHGKQKCRKFDTLDEHDTILVDNINKNVKFCDTLYHLGDWSFGGIEQISRFAERLNCPNIHLILGNHDHHIEKRSGNTNTYFTSIQHYLNTKLGKHSVVMSHYAMRTWDKGHHGTWMLYGHSHGTLENYSAGYIGNQEIFYKTMDVGIDTHPEFRPYHLDELEAIMRDRVPLLVDHHNPTTN